MSEEMEHGNGSNRVTMKMLMEELEKFRQYLDERFTRLESTISDSYQRKDVCRERYTNVCAQLEESDKRHSEALDAAVAASLADREKIWARIHLMEQSMENVKTKAVTAAVGLSIVLPILTAIVTAVLVRAVVGQ